MPTHIIMPSINISFNIATILHVCGNTVIILLQCILMWPLHHHTMAHMRRIDDNHVKNGKNVEQFHRTFLFIPTYFEISKAGTNAKKKLTPISGGPQRPLPALPGRVPGT